MNHPKIKGEPTEEEMVQDYIAKWYPKRYSGTGFLYHSEVVTDMLNGIKFRDGRQSDKVLDVGCGIGFVSQLYPNFDITGIDISEGMLAHNPYIWKKAAAEDIPFEDNTFDFVICRSLLHHLDKPEVGMREMIRVLKPGGRWVCWETNFSILNDIVRRISRLTPRFSHWHKNFKSKELIGMLQDCGLKIQSTRYMGYLAYPLIGFPDIINFHLPIQVGRILLGLDSLISQTVLAPLGWAIMIKGTK